MSRSDHRWPWSGKNVLINEGKGTTTVDHDLERFFSSTKAKTKNQSENLFGTNSFCKSISWKVWQQSAGENWTQIAKRANEAKRRDDDGEAENLLQNGFQTVTSIEITESIPAGNREKCLGREKLTWNAYGSFLITKSNPTPFSNGIFPSLSSLPHSPFSKALRTTA